MVKRTIKRIIAEQNVSTKAKRAKVSQPAQKSITLKFYPLTNNKIREPIQLPKIYLDTHTETFIDGLKFIVDKDLFYNILYLVHPLERNFRQLHFFHFWFTIVSA